jgi:hypothetical protein
MTVKISDYTALTSAASGDLLEIVDISDTTMAVTGTNKKIVLSDLLASVLPLAGGTMTGTITSTIGAITTNKPAFTATQEWNDSGVNFDAFKINVTRTLYGIASNLFLLQQNGGTVLRVGGNDGSGNTKIVVGVGIQEINNAFFLDDFWGYRVTNTGGYGFCNGAANGAPDAALFRNAAGVVEVNNGTAGTYRDLIARTLMTAPSSANGQSINYGSLTELTTIAAAATTDTVIQLPANAIIDAVTVRVTTAIPTAANFTVGDSGSAARFSTAAVSSAANSTDAGTKAGAYYNSTATSVRITPDATPGANTGRVRVTIFYHYVTVATS